MMSLDQNPSSILDQFEVRPFNTTDAPACVMLAEDAVEDAVPSIMADCKCTCTCPCMCTVTNPRS